MTLREACKEVKENPTTCYADSENWTVALSTDEDNKVYQVRVFHRKDGKMADFYCSIKLKQIAAIARKISIFIPQDAKWI